jgi:hypothetical protein
MSTLFHDSHLKLLLEFIWPGGWGRKRDSQIYAHHRNSNEEEKNIDKIQSSQQCFPSYASMLANAHLICEHLKLYKR